MTTDVETESDIGCILGSAIGDAVGEIAQHHDWNAIDWEALQSGACLLEYTDDTAMCIGVMESLIDKGTIRLESLGARFHRNWAMEPDRGYSDGPPTIFLMNETQSVCYRKAAQRVNRVLHGKAGSAGDGAAMRAQPIGLFMRHRFSPRAITRAARRSARATHTNPIALDGAVVVALSVRYAALSAAQPAIDLESYLRSILKYIKTRDMRDALLRSVNYAASDMNPSSVASRLGNLSRSTTSAISVVPFAAYCFLREPSTFVRCLEIACCSGGDADTIGAIACAISGARVGVTGLPEWLYTRLENVDYLLKLVDGCRIRIAGRAGFDSFAVWRRDIAVRDDEGLEEL